MNLRKILCGSLMAVLGLSIFSFTSVIAETNGVIEVGKGEEKLYGVFNKITNATDYNAYVKLSSASNYTKLDDQLVREVNGNIRVDAVGLKAGNYNLKFVPVINSAEDTTKQIELTDIVVEADDRSGYAHFNYSDGVGAYNNDGTLKDNAVVVYVTDSNKNDVEAEIGGKTYKGLANILSKASASEPLDIRIIGSVKTTQWDSITYTSSANSTALFNEQKASIGGSTSSKIYAETILENKWNSYSNDLANGIETLDGLTSYISYSKSSKGIEKYDSYWNMMNVQGKSNITIEGIGADATIFQWGLTFSKCNSIEVKNLTFDDYTEDAVGIQGEEGNENNYSTYWIHNCTFEEGVNNWDLSYEKDKADGDGSTDFKYAHNLTISYCKYNGTHKTNLIGSGNDALQYNVTLHHNYYLNCKARLPLVRQSNIHMYNNYYSGTTSTGISARAHSFAFVENCYFDGKNPYMLAYEVKDNVDPIGTTIKAIGNEFSNATTTSDSSSNGLGIKENGIFILTGSGSSKAYSSNKSATRTTNADSTSVCMPDGSTNYSNFDTNSSLFYYDSSKQKSNVTVMNDASELPTLIPTVAGAGIFSDASYTVVGGNETENLKEVEYDNTSTATILNENFDNLPEITTLTTNSVPTNPGIYQYVNNNAEVGTNINASITNNSLYLYDNDASNTLYAYYILGNTYNEGVISYKIKVKMPTQNASWTIASLLGESTNFDIRTDSTKKIGYSLDGGTTVTAVTTDSYTTNTEYELNVKIDYTNQKLTIKIGDDEVNNIGYSQKIKGFKFMTAGGTRSIYINSISIEKEETLKLGYQLGTYTQNDTSYKALRIIGKFNYDDVVIDSSNIDSIVINVELYNSSDVKYNTISATIDNLYTELAVTSNSETVVVAPEVDGQRYYYTVIKGIKSKHTGYHIKATTTITLKNGVVINCTGFDYKLA